MNGARVVAAALALLALTVTGGCGAPAAAPAPTAAAASTPVSTPTPDPSTPVAGSPDDVACAAHPGSVATVHSIAGAAAKGPILPAGVALFLVDVRMKAADPLVTDPDLAAARAELVAAIDDLDAQGKALLPPGGNPARDAVPLDTTRIVAAADAVERLCAAR